MSLRDALAEVLARDSRYTVQAYAFVFEALEYSKGKLKRARLRDRERPVRNRTAGASHHVTGQELCQGARELALRQYGLMTLTVLNNWGIRSTADIGEIVYNLIATGDLEKSSSDSRKDFDSVYDFESAFRGNYDFEFDEVA